MGQITPQQKWQDMQRLLKIAKEWAKGGKAHGQAKAQPRKEQALKNEKPENGLHHKKPRMGSRMCRQAFKPRRTREQ